MNPLIWIPIALVVVVLARKTLFGSDTGREVGREAGSIRVDAAVEAGPHEVVMTRSGDRKINVIKAVRQITGLGLKEAKDMADSPPCTVKRGLSLGQAEKAVADLREAGATAEVRTTGIAQP